MSTTLKKRKSPHELSTDLAILTEQKKKKSEDSKLKKRKERIKSVGVEDGKGKKEEKSKKDKVQICKSKLGEEDDNVENSDLVVQERVGEEEEREEEAEDVIVNNKDEPRESKVNKEVEREKGPKVEKDQASLEDEDTKEAEKSQDPQKSFADIGIMPSLIEACTKLNYKNPTPIQAESIPHALAGRDIIALAETGSGKTAAFALPILQALWDNPRPFFACILAPTRELAFQIAEAFDALGGGIGVKTATIVGGMDMVTQAMALGRRPHIVVATPGRLLDHLENTKGFSLRGLKFLVMDEADKLLDLDFGPSLDKIFTVIPKDRKTYLFSATMTSKVEKLQRASLSNPLRIQVSSKYQTVKTLLQYYIFLPQKHKDTYLVYLVNEFAGQSIIIFTRTINETYRISIMLRSLGFAAIPLNGQLSQSSRSGALTKFKSGSRNILVSTDVAARGLDIPNVDCVLHYDLAQDSKTYIHRAGRTARAGKAGKSICLTTQYDIELLLRTEHALGKKLPEFPTEKETVLLFSERVGEAQREAVKQMRESAEKLKGKAGRSGGVGGAGKGKGKGKGKRGNGDNDREEEDD